MAKAIGLSHIAYNVADLERSIGFYCTVLGFEKAFGITIPDNTYTIWIKDPDGNRIELMEYTEKSLQKI